MSYLNLSALQATPLQRDPFDYLVVPGFLPPQALAAVNRDYPDIPDPANYAPDRLRFGPAFEQLLEELRQPAFNHAMSAKFGVALNDSPVTVTVRKYCERSDGDIHTDHWSKLVTMLVYFNTDWPHEGGQLRMLRSAADIEDFVAEVAPVNGTLLAFRRTRNSFHGHKRFVGERRMLQMSWVRADPVARYAQRIARLSTHTFKRLQRLGGPL